jgi:hypothetical protein
MISGSMNFLSPVSILFWLRTSKEILSMSSSELRTFPQVLHIFELHNLPPKKFLIKYFYDVSFSCSSRRSKRDNKYSFASFCSRTFVGSPKAL